MPQSSAQEWRYSPGNLQPRHQLEKSGEPRAPATLPPKKGLPIQIGQDGRWDPERARAENLTPTG